jgi:hypothetical protein
MYNERGKSWNYNEQRCISDILHTYLENKLYNNGRGSDTDSGITCVVPVTQTKSCILL